METAAVAATETLETLTDAEKAARNDLIARKLKYWHLFALAAAIFCALSVYGFSFYGGLSQWKTPLHLLEAFAVGAGLSYVVMVQYWKWARFDDLKQNYEGRAVLKLTDNSTLLEVDCGGELKKYLLGDRFVDPEAYEALWRRLRDGDRIRFTATQKREIVLKIEPADSSVKGEEP